MEQTDLPLEPRHLGVPLGGCKIDFLPYGTFGTNRAPILPQDSTIANRTENELSLEPLS
jgi:hypothetical protein